MFNPEGAGIRWKAVLGYIIAAFVVVSIVKLLQVNGHQFRLAITSIQPLRLLAGLALLIGALGLNALGFSKLMQALKPGLSSKLSAAAWLSSTLAKYLPIGFGHAVGRGVIMSGHGVSVRTTVLAALAEQFMSILACVIVGAIAYAAGDVAAYDSATLVGGAIVVCAAAASVAMVFVVMVRRVQMRVRDGLGSFLCYLLAMVPYAVAYVIVVQPDQELRFVYELFVATVAGVATFLVPGGVGVRESVATSFATRDAATGVLAGMVAVRCLIFGAEVVGAVLGRYWLRRSEA